MSDSTFTLDSKEGFEKVNVEVGNSKSYSEINFSISEKTTLSVDDLNKLFKISKPGSVIKIELSGSLEKDYVNEVKINLKFAGFKGITYKEEDGKQFIFGKNKTSELQDLTATIDQQLNVNKWKIQETKSEDLLNENDLVNPNDIYEKFSKKNDCITKPKPCKNCNCGRAKADGENPDKNNATMPKSECGNCYLGDAFRCEGCPYRGLPAFEKGQKVVFNTDSKDSNIDKEEPIVVKGKDNKVKIDLDM